MTAQYTSVMKDLRKLVPPKREILKGIHLSFYPGAKIGVLGNNGAGKSTLLRMLARIYPPTLGHVAIRGTVAPLIEMGAGFNPDLTGRQNVYPDSAGIRKTACQAGLRRFFFIDDPPRFSGQRIAPRPD